MPELPEVETTKRGIAPHITHKQIAKIDLFERRLRWTVPDTLKDSLPQQKIERVRRRAKYIILDLTEGSLLIHLGMSGSLLVVTPDTPRTKHDHIDLHIDADTVLRFNDPRRFGSWHYVTGDIEGHPLLNKLGPEPLSEEFNGEYLYKLSRTRRLAIKPFIMDQKTVVGVGNIYAGEALFMSGIHPKRSALRVSEKRFFRLTENIKTVLERAIGLGGTTLRDFVGGDGKPGYFQQTLLVYGREGMPCTICGQALKNERLGQRASVFCSNCQK